MTTHISTRGPIGQPFGRDDVERVGSRIRSLAARLRRPHRDDRALNEWRPPTPRPPDMQTELARAMWRLSPR